MSRILHEKKHIIYLIRSLAAVAVILLQGVLFSHPVFAMTASELQDKMQENTP